MRKLPTRTLPKKLTGQLSEVKAGIESLELLLADWESLEDEAGRQELDETIYGEERKLLDGLLVLRNTVYAHLYAG
jgi:hypothetical protein